MYVVALAIFFPEKYNKKLVSDPDSVPELPNPLAWQVRPRQVEHTAPLLAVTLKNNLIYHMSGRSPKVAGNTLLHSVNNYWYDSTGHSFEADSGAKILVEGSVFQNIATPVEAGGAGKLLAITGPLVALCTYTSN